MRHFSKGVTIRLRIAVAAAVALSALVVVGSATSASGSGLAVSSASLDFGSVKVNSVASATLTLTNNGTQTLPPLGIWSAFRGGPDRAAWIVTFSNCPPAAGLATGQSCSVQLQFQPLKAGRHKTRLVLSDSNGDSVSVDLSGTGT